MIRASVEANDLEVGVGLTPPHAAPGANASPTLRDAAIAADADALDEHSLEMLWRELTSGLTRIVDGFFTDERCYLVIGRGVGTPIPPRRRAILEAALCGQRQKNVAMDTALAPSTVALNCRIALETLGASGKPSRVHPLVMLMAYASRNAQPIAAQTSAFITSQRELRVVSVPRPDLSLRAKLPAAELSVIRALVEGASYGQIARQRGTSTRTIANQISAVFRRLHVSGRNELVQRLLLEEMRGEAAARRTRMLADRGDTPRKTLSALPLPAPSDVTELRPARRSA
jgi:DNA-binding NarL/FixJ family response regulator